MHAVAILTKRVSLAFYVELGGIEAMPDNAYAALPGSHRRLDHAVTLAAAVAVPAGLTARTALLPEAPSRHGHSNNT
jgi:hypothetical protein